MNSSNSLQPKHEKKEKIDIQELVKNIENIKDCDEYFMKKKVEELIKAMTESKKEEERQKPNISFDNIINKLKQFGDSKWARRNFLILYIEIKRLYPNNLPGISKSALFSYAEKSDIEFFFLSKYTMNFTELNYGFTDKPKLLDSSSIKKMNYSLTTQDILQIYKCIYKKNLINKDFIIGNIEIIKNFYISILKILEDEKHILYKNGNVLWLFYVLYSFLDAFILDILVFIEQISKTDKKENITVYKTMIPVYMDTMFQGYWNLKKGKFFNKELKHKIMCILCLYASFLFDSTQFKKNNNNHLIKICFDMNNNNNIVQDLIVILVLLEKIAKHEPIKQFDLHFHKEYYLFSYNFINSYREEDFEKEIENTLLSDYYYHMDKIYQFNCNYNTYKGALILIAYIYLNNNQPKESEKKISITVLINLIYEIINNLGELAESKVANILIDSLRCLYSFASTAKLLNDEWKKTLKIITIICEKEKEEMKTNYEYSKYIIETLSILTKQQYFEINKQTFENIIIENWDIFTTHIDYYYSFFINICIPLLLSKLKHEHFETIINFLIKTYLIYTEQYNYKIERQTFVEELKNIRQSLSEQDIEKCDIIDNEIYNFYNITISDYVQKFPSQSFSQELREMIDQLKELTIYIIVNTKQMNLYESFLKLLIKYKGFATELQKKLFLSILSGLNDKAQKEKLHFLVNNILLSFEENKEKKRIKISSKKILLLLFLIQKFSISSLGIITINDTKNEQEKPCLKIKNKEEEYDDNYVYFDYNIICKLIHFYFTSKQSEKDKSNNNKAYIYNFNANIFNFFNDSINDRFTKESLQFIANLIYNFNFLSNLDNNLFRTQIQIATKLTHFLNFQNDIYLGDPNLQKNDYFLLEDDEPKLKFNFLSNLMEHGLKKEEQLEFEKLSMQVYSQIAFIYSYICYTINSVIDIKNDTDSILKYINFEREKDKIREKDKKKEKAKEYNKMQIMIDTLLGRIFELLNTEKEVNFEWSLLFLMIINNVKEVIIKFSSSQLIKTILILLIIGWNKNKNSVSSTIEFYFKKFDSKLSLSKKVIPFENEQQHFIQHMSDLLLLFFLRHIDPKYNYYTSHINKEKIVREIKKNRIFKSVSDGLKESHSTSRWRLLNEFANFFIKSHDYQRNNLSSFSKEELIKQLNDMTIIFDYNTKKIWCLKDGEYNKCNVIILSYISNLQIEISTNYNEIKEESEAETINTLESLIFKEEKQEANKISEVKKPIDVIGNLINIKYRNQGLIPPLLLYYLNDISATYNCNINNISYQNYITYRTKSERKDKIINSLVNIINCPTLISYTINIIYASREKPSKENLLSNLQKNDNTKSFIKFVSLLGKKYTNCEGLFYRDMFYNIKFEIVNVKETMAEKEKLLLANSINIIWLEEDKKQMNDIMNFMNQYESNKIVFFISRETEIHYLVSKIYKKNDERRTMLIEDMFVNYYMINVNSYSSIRYFINNLIILCEWIYYHPMIIEKKEDASKRESVNSRNSNEQKKKTNKFLAFLRLNKGESQNEEEKEKKEEKEEEKEKKEDFSYPSLNNCFYQRFSLIQELFSILAKTKEEKELEENEENDNNEQEKELERENSQ